MLNSEASTIIYEGKQLKRLLFLQINDFCKHSLKKSCLSRIQLLDVVLVGKGLLFDLFPVVNHLSNLDLSVIF